MIVRTALLAIALTVAGCGAFPKEKDKDSSNDPDDHSGQSDGGDGEGEGDGGGEGGALTINSRVVIFEPGADLRDRAVLFLLKPSKDSYDVFGIKQKPDFLSGESVQTFNKDSAANLFQGLSQPLPEKLRTQLLADYDGALALYFEQFDKSLCNDQAHHFEFVGTVGDVTPTTVIEVKGLPDSTGVCTYNYLSMTSSY